MKKFLIIPLMALLLLCTGCKKTLDCTIKDEAWEAQAIVYIDSDDIVTSLDFIVEYDASKLNIGEVEEKIKNIGGQLEEQRRAGIIESFRILNKKEIIEIKISGKSLIFGEEYKDMTLDEIMNFFEKDGGTCK